MKRFNDFLNESMSKTFQYDISKEIIESFENEVYEKSQELGIDTKINKTKGVSLIKVLFKFNGDVDDINSLIEWIKENY